MSEKPKKIQQISLTEKEFNELREQMDQSVEALGGTMAPTDKDEVARAKMEILRYENLQAAVETEGLDKVYVAKKLKMLLESTAAKWNPATKDWDYFIDGDLYYKCLDMLIKIHGGYAPEKNINLNINADLEKMLLNTDLPPEQAQAQISGYIDEITGKVYKK